MDKIKTVKIKNEDGSISEESYTIAVDAKNVDMSNGIDLQDTIGTININKDGNIAEQLENLNDNVDNLNIDIKKKAYFFDTVADMKNADLKVGDYVCTLGYYEPNDGGAGEYKIQKNLTPNEMNIISINSALSAELICDVANVLQFGAYGDGSHNDTSFFQACANYAENNNLKFFVPDKKYSIGTITLNNIKIIDIQGTLKLLSSTQLVNIFESTDMYACNIYINRVTTGKIIMKGLNTSDVRIQRAYNLTLLADNTDNHHWISYSKFYLGFINTLNILDDGSGGKYAKYINENLFIGGRFANINIGTENSKYRHENNLFLKPMCEDCIITLNYARNNIFEQIRLEGDRCQINFEEKSMANIVKKSWRATNIGYWVGKASPEVTINDNSYGRNKVEGNSNLNENLITNINILNNPKNLPIQDNKLYPIANRLMYESDLFILPDKESALIFNSDETHYRIYITCYDENKNEITEDPKLSDDLLWPGLSWSSSNHYYYNNGYSYNNYIVPIKPNNNVKYLKFKIYSLEVSTRYLFENIKITFNSYDYINPLVLDMAKKYL